MVKRLEKVDFVVVKSAIIKKERWGACYSTDQVHRYSLWRCWNRFKKPIIGIFLNPSTATHTRDDRTIKKVSNWAKENEYGGLYVLNIFAYRARDPEIMKDAYDPTGPLNDDIIKIHLSMIDGKIITGWGNNGTFINRSNQIRKIVPDHRLYCFAKNNNGEPSHPVYLGLKKLKKL